MKGTHLPITIKEIQAGYLNSPYFKDLYLYLSQNKLPSLKGAMCKIEILSERYILLDSLLFKLNVEKEKAVLAIPEVCVDQINALYHSSLSAGHQGFIKTHLTICMDVSHSVCYHVIFLFSLEQNKIFSCETSFCQNPSWLLPGLRKMLF